MYKKFSKRVFMRYFRENIFSSCEGADAQCDKQAVEEAIKLMDNGDTICLVGWYLSPIMHATTADYVKIYTTMHLDAKRGYVEKTL